MRTPAEQTEMVRNALAFLLIAAFISTVPLLVWKTIDAENKDLLTYILGQLSGMALMVLGFYFVNKAGQDAVDAKKVELDQARAENTGKLADAVKAAVTTTGSTEGASLAADSVAEAAVEKAEEFKGIDNAQ